MQQPQSQPPFSPDGRWWWDGGAWQPLYSPDGSQRWDGRQWVQVEPVALAVVAPLEPAEPERPSWLPADVKVPSQFARAADGPAPQAALREPIPLRPAAAAHPRNQAGWSSSSGFRTIACAGLIGLIAIGGFAYNRLNGGGGSIAPDVLAASDARLAYQPATVERYWVHETQHGRLTLPSGQSRDTQSDVDAYEAMRVIAVDSKGLTTLGFKFEKLTGSEDGQPVFFNAARAKEITIVISPDGRIVSGGTNGSAGEKASQSVPGADQSSAIMPSHDVKQGDKWGSEWDRPNPVGGGTMHYATVNEFVRYDYNFGKKQAVIHTSTTLPIDIVMDLHAILALYGDEDPTLPKGASISYAGKYTADIQSWVDLETREIASSMATEDFDFDMNFQGLGNSKDAAALAGKWHYGGRQVSQTKRLDSTAGAAPKTS